MAADSRRMDTMRKMVHGLAMRADQRHIARLEFRRRITCSAALQPFTKKRIEVTDIP